MAYNLGSVVSEVGARLDNIPSSISGTNMNNIIIEEANFIETENGISLGSPIAFTNPYCSAIIKLVMSNVQSIIEAQGSDKSSIHLGELSVSKSSSASDSFAQKWRVEAIKDLRSLKGKYNYYQTFS
ncbi:MAG: hypothetical protein KKF27_20850 [Gammaproteobacteria bacterium]|nr:hypothetical protein [Gammaproteobacteria bacterium]